nr:universal stress protein [Oceanobacillus chungangensis]
MEYGSPRTVITNEIADSVGADLIICGATGFITIERYLLVLYLKQSYALLSVMCLVIRTPE